MKESSAATRVHATVARSAGWDELSELATMRLLGLLCPLRRRGDRNEQRERRKREEPGHVEVEPVRQHELEAEDDRRCERGELERRLAAGGERGGGPGEDGARPQRPPGAPEGR